MDLNMNITFMNVPCSILSLDIEDITGEHVVGVEGRMHKHDLDSNGRKMGNTLDEVRNQTKISKSALIAIWPSDGRQ
jgi:hypothetical protein